MAVNESINHDHTIAYEVEESGGLGLQTDAC
jgi:hypothetical protein